jgi:2,4-dienoyl-CoA reductase-like NADH-dependent reductase (Old Yellow Enzyme family)
VEATAVSPEGRISPWDSGIWSDDHAQAFKRITRFISEQCAVPGIQLAHAGRKASTDLPWRSEKPLAPSEGGWQLLASSPLPFDKMYPVPRELTQQEIGEIMSQFAAATRRSLETGFKVVEIQMAHGYLHHEFLSPLSNQRTDEYGGSFENRVRLPLDIAASSISTSQGKIINKKIYLDFNTSIGKWY